MIENEVFTIENQRLNNENKNKINSENNKKIEENKLSQLKRLNNYIILRNLLSFIIIIMCFFLSALTKRYYNRFIRNDNENNYVDKTINNNMINSNKNLEVKSSNIIRITHTQNETLVYKRIKNISILMEMNSKNITHNISIISNVLFHVYDIILKETGNNIYYANILLLNSTTYHDNDIYPQGGINIIQDLEEENVEYTESSKEDEENLSYNIPIMNFSFYSNGTIIEIYFAEGLKENMINILNESLYEIIPDISQSSNLRILLSKENGCSESKFQNERKEFLNFNGKSMNNSTINRISNHTINNEIEKITRINTFGQAILINNQDDNNNLNEKKNNNINNIENGISKMIINESSTTTLVLSTINITINEIINQLNNNTNYSTNINEEYLSFKLLSNTNKYRKLSNFDYIKFTRNYSYSYEIFSTNLFDVDIKLNLNIQTNLSPSKIIVQGIFTLGSNEYLLFEHFIKTNSDEVLSRYLKESKQIKKILDETSESLRIIIKKDWTKQIKELLENLKTPLENVYDISNLYKEPLKKILKIFVDSSKNIFKEMESYLLTTKKNLEDISKNLLKQNYELIYNMVEEIRNQYINYLLSIENNIIKTQNIFSEYLNNIYNNIIQSFKTFDPIIYDIQTKLLRPIDLLNIIEKNVLTSIENKVQLMNKTLINYQNKLIGNELYNLELLINNLTSSPVLQEGISIEERENFKQIIKSIIEEINNQNEIIYSHINDNYIQDKRYRTNFSNYVHNNISLINQQSNNLINNIKEQIENFELMELYVKDLDKLDSIENVLLLMVNTRFFDIFLKYENYLLIYKLNDDFLKIKENELKLASNNILGNIKEEILETKLKFYNHKLNLTETYRLELGDLAYFLIEKVTKEVLQILVNDYYNVMESLRQKMQKYDEYNHNLLTQYLKRVVNDYSSNDNAFKYKGNAISNQYKIFSDRIEKYQKWVKENFEKKMKEKYFFIYDKIMNTLNEKIFQKIDLKNYYKDENLHFLSDYLDYLQTVKDLINSYISEVNFNNKVKFDIDIQYNLFLNNYMSLYKKNYDLLRKIDWVPITDECGDDDYCFMKKKKWYKSGKLKTQYKYYGYQVNERFKYINIVESHDLREIDDLINKVYNNFMDRYLPTILNYEKIIEFIDKSVKDEQTNIFNKYIHSNKFDQKIIEYKNKIEDLINSILGDEILKQNYHKIKSDNIGNLIANYYSIINIKDKITNEFYKPLFNENYQKYLQVPNEVLFRLNQIQDKLINIGEKFEIDLNKVLITKLNTILKFLYYKVSDILYDNYNYLRRNIFFFDDNKITESRINIITSIQDYINSKLSNKYQKLFTNEYISNEINQVIDLNNLNESKINSNDLFLVSSQINNNNKILQNLSQLIQKVKSSIKNYIEKPLNYMTIKNSNLTKIHQSKNALTIIKYYSDIIIKSNLFKNFKQEDYVSLFKEFVSINEYSILNDINNYLKNIYPKDLEKIGIFLDKINDDIQGLFTQYIMNLEKMNYIFENFIKNGFNIIKWQRESIEISINNFKNQIQKLFKEELDNLIKDNKKYLFNETNMNTTYFQIKEKLFNPIRDLMNNNYKFSVNINFIHKFINETQIIMKKDALKMNEILKQISSKNDKILLLGYDISISDIIIKSIWPKIFDYSNGIFFNYTKKFKKEYSNMKIDISGVKKYINEKYNELNVFIDNEYYWFRQKIKDKSMNVINDKNEEKIYEEPEHEKEETIEEENENPSINFNLSDIFVEEEELPEVEDKTEYIEKELEIIKICDICVEEELDPYENEKCAICIDDSEDEDYDDNEDYDEERRLLNKKSSKFNFNEKNLRILQSINNYDLIISNFTKEFIQNMYITSDNLTNIFNKILSNDAILNNIIQNISLYDEDFFHTPNLNYTFSKYNFNDSIELIQSICNREIEKEISSFMSFIGNKIEKYYEDSLNYFTDRYGNSFIQTHIELIINDNLTEYFNLLNFKIEEMYNYLVTLLQQIDSIPLITYNQIIEDFDDLYNYIEKNIYYLYNQIIFYHFDGIYDKIANDITYYYVEKIKSNKILENNLNQIVYDVFKNTYFESNIKKLKNNTIKVLEQKNIGIFILSFNNSINKYLTDLKTNLNLKKQNIEKLFPKELIINDTIYQNLYDLSLKYQNDLNSIPTNNIFSFENISIYYDPFIINYIQPLLENLSKNYENISNNSLSKIEEEVKNFKIYSEKVEKEFDTENTMISIKNKGENLKNFLKYIIDFSDRTIYNISENILEYHLIQENKSDIINRVKNQYKNISVIELLEIIKNNLENNIRIRRLIKQEELRKISKINYTSITKSLKNISENVNNFYEKIKTTTEYNSLLSQKLSFNQKLDYGNNHISDPLNYIISQINYLPPTIISKFQELIENDINNIKIISKNHQEKINIEYNKILNIIKEFQTEFSKDTITNIFENNFNIIITYIYNNILNKVIYSKINSSLSNNTSPLNFKYKIPIFYLSFIFDIKVYWGGTYNLGTNLEYEKMKTGGELNTYCNIKAEASYDFGNIKFGGSINGLLGDGTIQYYTIYDLKNNKVNSISGYNIKPYNYQISAIMELPHINSYEREITLKKQKHTIVCKVFGKDKYYTFTYYDYELIYITENYDTKEYIGETKQKNFENEL